MRALCVSALASNQGKSVLTMALLHHFKESVRAFKIGPDFIDPQFHEKISSTPSINLDRFMMNDAQIKWLFARYADKEMAICEGVMGFYDGMDKGSSAYDVSKVLNIPTLLLLDGSSSYITISAVLKGLLTYTDDHTIKGVVFNKLSSPGHFELIKNQIEKDHKNIAVLGWIRQEIPSLSDTHLGLDLKAMQNVQQIAKEVLKHIDTQRLNELASNVTMPKTKPYPFDTMPKQNKKLVIVNDENFSFLYHDNKIFLEEVFSEVVYIKSTKDEPIPLDADIVYIVGGYVETAHHYKKIKHAMNFKNSLIKHAKSKPLYAECAGLLYLSNRVDDKPMSGILDLDFSLHRRFVRMGYYHSKVLGAKGHAFHYTNVLDPKWGNDIISKDKNGSGSVGSWQKEKVFGTYLHTMLRCNPQIIKEKFLDGR